MRSPNMPIAVSVPDATKPYDIYYPQQLGGCRVQGYAQRRQAEIQYHELH